MHVSDFILCLCHTCGKSYICQIFCWKRILSSFAACHKEVWKHTGCYLDGFPPAETWHNHVYTGTHWLQFRRKWGCHHQNSGSHDGIHVACFRMKMETLAICDYFELNKNVPLHTHWYIFMLFIVCSVAINYLYRRYKSIWKFRSIIDIDFSILLYRVSNLTSAIMG